MDVSISPQREHWPSEVVPDDDATQTSLYAELPIAMSSSVTQLAPGSISKRMNTHKSPAVASPLVSEGKYASVSLQKLLIGSWEAKSNVERGNGAVRAVYDLDGRKLSYILEKSNTEELKIEYSFDSVCNLHRRTKTTAPSSPDGESGTIMEATIEVEKRPIFYRRDSIQNKENIVNTVPIQPSLLNVSGFFFLWVGSLHRFHGRSSQYLQTACCHRNRRRGSQIGGHMAVHPTFWKTHRIGQQQFCPVFQQGRVNIP